MRLLRNLIKDSSQVKESKKRKKKPSCKRDSNPRPLSHEITWLGLRRCQPRLNHVCSTIGHSKSPGSIGIKRFKASQSLSADSKEFPLKAFSPAELHFGWPEAIFDRKPLISPIEITVWHEREIVQRRERERECVCVRTCVERERECVCAYVCGERERVCVCGGRERENEE